MKTRDFASDASIGNNQLPKRNGADYPDLSSFNNLLRNSRVEAELVAQDQDAARVAAADIDDGRAHSLVDDDVVTPIPDERILVHEPSDEAFDSILQLAVFHRGWTAARDTDEGGA